MMRINRISIIRNIGVLLVFLFCLTSLKEKPYIEGIGVCTSFSEAEMLAEHGFTYIEESVGRFLMPTKSDHEFDSILVKSNGAALPVKACNSFLPGNLKSVGTEAVHSEILKFAEVAFKRAQQAGVEIIVFGSGGSRSIPEGFPRERASGQFISLLKQMGPIAEKYKVTVVIEPLNKKECNFINSVIEGGEIVSEVGHPNIRLLADIYHMKMDDESPESIIKYGHLIKHVHVAEKEGRSAPGTHNEDIAPYYKALKKVGYKGRLSIECKWENMETQAGKAYKTITYQL
jgi:sugar phosphate isomerase/epimerase